MDLMTAGVMRGLVGASSCVKLSNTTMGVYRQAEGKGDEDTMKRALGYTSNLMNSAKESSKDAQEAMEKAQKEADRQTKKEQQEALEKQSQKAAREAKDQQSRETSKQLENQQKAGSDPVSANSATCGNSPVSADGTAQIDAADTHAEQDGNLISVSGIYTSGGIQTAEDKPDYQSLYKDRSRKVPPLPEGLFFFSICYFFNFPFHSTGEAV